MVVSSKICTGTHAIGNDLVINCIGPNQYQISLALYRDCNGINLPNSRTVSWTSCVGSGSVTLTKISQEDITSNCPSTATACAGGSGAYGTEKWVYEATVTLPPGTCVIRFSHTLCCRANGITSLTNPGGERLYTETYVTPTTPCNNSPAFAFDPITIVPINQPQQINYTCYDLDGDSLVYSLTDALNGFNDPVGYAPGYSGIAPLGPTVPITINPNNGTLSFTPNILGYFVIAVKIDEYRNGVWIGSTIRDVNLIVINTVSTPPIITGINGTNAFDTTICANVSTSIDIYLISPDDQNIGGTFASNSPGISGTLNQISNDTAILSLSWSPSVLDTGFNLVYVLAVDSVCPYYNMSIQGFNIYVDTAPPVPDAIVLNPAACHNSTDGEAFHNSTGLKPGYSITWYDSLYNPISNLDTLTGVGAGTFYVEIQNSGFDCTASDTVIIPNNDSSPPVITCPSTINGILDATCSFTIPDYTQSITFTDNCGIKDTIQYPSAGSIITSDTIISIVVIDYAGLKDSCSFTLEISDTTQPSISCPGNASVYADANCEYILDDYTLSTSASDLCGTFALTQTPAMSSVQSGLTVVNIVVTDTSGNANSCQLTVTPIDTINPVFTCLPDQTIHLDAACQAVLPDFGALLSPIENCGSYTINQSPAIGAIITANTGASVTVQDTSGNLRTCNFNIILVDTTPPLLTCPTTQIEYLDNSCNYSVIDFTTLVSGSDNCGNVNYTQSPSVGSIINGSGTQTISITGIDDSGNSASCSFNLDILDTITPIISCPSNRNEYVDATCSFSLPDYTGLSSSSDNCAILNVSQSPSVGTIISSNTTVWIIAEDVNGNTDSCSFDITLLDTISPTISCPGPQSIFVDASCSYALPDYTSSVVANDNCGISSIAQVPVAGSTQSGSITVSLFVTDISGNSTNCSFLVNPIDSTAPTINCPTNQDVYLDINCEYSLDDFTVAATTGDNCGFITISQSPAVSTIFNGESAQIVQLIVTDSSGNTNSCSFTANIIDTISPMATCPGNQNVFLDTNCQYIIPDYTASLISSDNCGVSTVSQSLLIGSAISTDTIVTLYVTDINGNIDSCSFQIFFADTISPSIICPSTQSVYADINCNYTMPDYSTLISVSDNCGSVNTTQTPIAGTIQSGPVNVQIQATDAAGNNTSCSFMTQVIDTIAPAITCPPSQTIYLDNNCESIIPDYSAMASATDNCDPNPTLYQSDVGALLNGADTLDVYIIGSDINGNIDSCMFSIYILDTISPTIICPSDTSTCSQIVNYQMPLSDDACGIASDILITGFSSGSSFPVGLTTVTYETIDFSGNTATCSFDVLVSNAPEISFTGNSPLCNGDMSGFIDASVSGGIAPLAYQWSSGQTSEDINGIGGGFYQLIVTDSTGCLGSHDTTLIEPNPITGSLDITDVTCYGSNDGGIEANISGGTAPLTYLWNGTAGSNTLSGQGGGSYVLDIIDDNGCTYQISGSISEPDSLSVILDPTILANGHNISYPGTSDGEIFTIISGGTAPYLLAWSTGDTSASVHNLPAGIYSIQIEDANGCVVYIEIELTEPRPIVPATAFSPNDDGLNDYFIIQNIEDYPECEINILNRWGNSVFETKGYKNDWNGKAQSSLYGDNLPNGSYFYVLKLYPDSEVYKSYIIIQR